MNAPEQRPPAEAGRRKSVLEDVRSLVVSIPHGEQAVVESVERLSHSRAALAPLALTVGAFAMLYDGLRVLLLNWRLILIQILPAAWIWLAMWDIRARLVYGRPVPQLGGIGLALAFAGVVALTALSMYLNGVFGFAVSEQPPNVSRGFSGASRNRWAMLVPGLVLGVMLAFAALVTPGFPRPWYLLSMGAVVGLMMIAYVAVPARAIGLRRTYKRTDKWIMTAIGSMVGFVVMFPAYVLGRIGLLMIGSTFLRPFGIVLFAVAVILEIGATGAVRAVKLGSALVHGERPLQSVTRGEPAG